MNLFDRDASFGRFYYKNVFGQEGIGFNEEDFYAGRLDLNRSCRRKASIRIRVS